MDRNRQAILYIGVPKDRIHIVITIITHVTIVQKEKQRTDWESVVQKQTVVVVYVPVKKKERYVTEIRIYACYVHKTANAGRNMNMHLANMYVMKRNV